MTSGNHPYHAIGGIAREVAGDFNWTNDDEAAYQQMLSRRRACEVTQFEKVQQIIDIDYTRSMTLDEVTQLVIKHRAALIGALSAYKELP